ncbi:MAG: YaaL family protein [Lachnospiraceae bacterium]|nr:YaaL family protein [Lachnospiraceae bacterium]
MLFFRKPAAITEEYAALRQDLINSREEFERALSNFEQAVDPDMIDCYIYALNAASLRYKFLLNLAKEAGI